jgi:hypothetical protein
MSIAETIAAKSDQLNADDLIGGPIVARITGVSVKKGDEQPVAVELAGYRPFMPCKTMRRLMVAVWGPDEKIYVGRWLELYRDPKAKWAGTEVGGVRIAKMSHIDRAQTIMLAETKKSKAPWTVHPLRMPANTPAATADPLANFRAHLVKVGLDPAVVIEWIATLGQDIATMTSDGRKAWAVDLTDPAGPARTDLAAWLAARNAPAETEPERATDPSDDIP